MPRASHFLLATFLATAGATHSQVLSPAEQEVWNAEQAREAALQRADIAQVERLTAGDFIHIDTSGRILQRADWLARTPRKRLNDNYEDLRIRVYGDTAVLSAERSWTWQETGEKLRTRLLKIWVKRDGGWKAVASQSTKIAPRSAP